MPSGQLEGTVRTIVCDEPRNQKYFSRVKIAFWVYQKYSLQHLKNPRKVANKISPTIETLFQNWGILGRSTPESNYPKSTR